VLAFAVSANLLLLGIFKYANFAVDNLNALLEMLGLARIELAAVHLPIHLPIGISFFTFQALTYVIDVYRRDAPVQRNPFRLALYISLFPQLIAGPIVRYHQIAAQLAKRVTSLDDVAAGASRFVVGLGKKVLIANTLAVPADHIFAIPDGELQIGVAWLGALCYGLQIYFDFSGYSDMAIGLGRILGFRFPENFDYPYISRSLREFWRRWHISLSTWFRDYLYIPLGGSRGAPLRTYSNLAIVFVLCGLWHGASFGFVIWGLIHGAFMVLERLGLGGLLERTWRPLQHVYTLGAVTTAWVFFRAESLPQALGFLAAMFGADANESAHPIALYLDAEVLLTLLAALLGATPWLRNLWRSEANEHRRNRALAIGRVAALNLILLASAMSLAAGTHNPFIYFRF
jgi:alginate O-acetyltransferase complex protein AlgI